MAGLVLSGGAPQKSGRISNEEIAAALTEIVQIQCGRSRPQISVGMQASAYRHTYSVVIPAPYRPAVYAFLAGDPLFRLLHTSDSPLVLTATQAAAVVRLSREAVERVQALKD